MKDFDKLKKALDGGKMVILYKGRKGDVKFGRSFENEADIVGTKFSPSSIKSKKTPEYILVEKRPSTWIL